MWLAFLVIRRNVMLAHETADFGFYAKKMN